MNSLCKPKQSKYIAIFLLWVLKKNLEIKQAVFENYFENGLPSLISKERRRFDIFAINLYLTFNGTQLINLKALL